MIFVERTAKPSELTRDLEMQLVSVYRNTEESVWDLAFLKRALLQMSKGKCVYCECKITEESKYMEVEHFHPKSIYPDEVVSWRNLLPACKRCNGTKGNHDTGAQPIINPTANDPRLHLSLKNYRFKPKDALGKLTIEVLDLNDHERVVTPRFQIGEAVQDLLEDVLELAVEFSDGSNTTPKRRAQIRNRMRALLKEAQPDSEYSATAATVLFSQSSYTELKSILQDCGLWDDELNSLESDAQANRYVA